MHIIITAMWCVQGRGMEGGGMTGRVYTRILYSNRQHIANDVLLLFAQYI